MALEVDYLPVAISGTANVDPQSSFAGSPYQLNGFVDGIASPQQANKIWRQASMGAAVVAGFVSGILGINVLDDGNLPGLLANFVAAIRSLINISIAGLQPLLGFNPVQGGNGAGQEGNTIHIGWSGPPGGNRLLVSVDSAALGPLVFESELAPIVTQLDNEDINLQNQINVIGSEIATLSFANQTLAVNGHQKYPSTNGQPPLIEIWGTITTDINGGQLAVSFAPSGITFPNACFNVSVTTYSPTDRITYVVEGSPSKTGFTVGNNGSSGFAMWRALGN